MATAKRDLTDTEVQGRPRPRAADHGAANRYDVRQAATELVRRYRAQQGLGPKIDDPEIIARVVALLQPSAED